MMIISLIMLIAAVASSVLVTALVNPIGQASPQQQYVFAQGSTIAAASYDNTTANATFLPQIHNYTSLPLAQSTHGL